MLSDNFGTVYSSRGTLLPLVLLLLLVVEGARDKKLQALVHVEPRSPGLILGGPIIHSVLSVEFLLLLRKLRGGHVRPPFLSNECPGATGGLNYE